MEAFRTFLEGWLDRTGTTQAELSRASGVPQNVISRWVGPRPTRPGDRNLEKLAPIVGVPYMELLKLAGYLPGEAQIDEVDPDLAAVTAAWPRLSDGLREAIKVLVGVGGRVSGPSSARVSTANSARLQAQPAGAGRSHGSGSALAESKPRLPRPLTPRPGQPCILDRWLGWLLPRPLARA